MTTTYDRLARALKSLQLSEGRTRADKEGILFAYEQIEHVLADMRAAEEATKHEPL